MNFKLDKDIYSYPEEKTNYVAEQSIEGEISLPDYCPSVQKILKCFSIVNITSCSIQGDRATAQGEVLLRLVYIGEDNTLSAFSQPIPFSRYVELGSSAPEQTLFVNAKSEYINCRAVNQKRISVSGSISLTFSVSKPIKASFVCGCNGYGIETKCEKEAFHTLVGEYSRVFDMSETAVLEDGKPPVLSVLKTVSYPNIESVKVIKNKMLIKGEMVTDIIYIADNEVKGIEKIRHTMPISQITEVQGIEENDTVITFVKVLSSMVNMKSDSEGKLTLPEITIKSEINVEGYRTQELCLIKDTYSTDYELNEVYSEIPFRTLLFVFDEIKQMKRTIENVPEIKSIKEVFPITSNAIVKYESNSLTVSCFVLSGILYYDSEDSLSYTEKTVEYSFDVPAGNVSGKITAEPIVTVREIFASGTDITLSLGLYMPVYEIKTALVCTDIMPDEGRQKPQSDYPLTAYYPGENETLWLIAKKLGTTVNKIKEENDIADEISQENMLLIPM